ncbi:hypothetical protein E2C01_058757 [Portunus trituberculatus]|uniref:Uncharacterized protein n=1 Tax=Portunus trituberculatus TaxID=210409 RepID=A0A5B7H3X5_PORTR|nr:hypothetical protein [Portunus trituberculatus]
MRTGPANKRKFKINGNRPSRLIYRGEPSFNSRHQWNDSIIVGHIAAGLWVAEGRTRPICGGEKRLAVG